MKLTALFIVIGAAFGANLNNNASTINASVNANKNTTVDLKLYDPAKDGVWVDVLPGPQVVVWEDGLFGVSRDVLYEVRESGRVLRGVDIRSELILIGMTPIREGREEASVLDADGVRTMRTNWSGKVASFHGLAWRGGPMPSKEVFYQEYVERIFVKEKLALEVLFKRQIGSRSTDGKIEVISVVHVHRVPPLISRTQ